ncbi:MAG: hypothetical protein JXQ76_00035, partial [Campylobacterales bacterium]|nr:hypothetical protein [Campylobacterales bacterium]
SNKRSNVSLMSLSKDDLLDLERYKQKPNFSIDYVQIKHPARDIPFKILKDFSSVIYFKRNIFAIQDMRAMILDGSLDARSIMVNIADLNPANMEFKMLMDITNIDIGALDRLDGIKIDRDADLSLSANFTSKGLDVANELNTIGYIDIYKIGDKFANKLMKGLNSEKGKSKLGFAQYIVDGFTLPKGFNFKLDKGLMYVTVTLERKIIGNITGVMVKNDKIKFDRVSIQQYLRKVSSQEKK